MCFIASDQRCVQCLTHVSVQHDTDTCDYSQLIYILKLLVLSTCLSRCYVLCSCLFLCFIGLNFKFITIHYLYIPWCFNALLFISI